jgi:hypothetical protein
MLLFGCAMVRYVGVVRLADLRRGGSTPMTLQPSTMPFSESKDSLFGKVGL